MMDGNSFCIPLVIIFMTRSRENKKTIDMLLKGKEAHQWNKALSNDWGRLAQDNKHVS